MKALRHTPLLRVSIMYVPTPALSPVLLCFKTEIHWAQYASINLCSQQ